MVDWYERKGQTISILHESSYGTPTGGSAWTSLAAAETALNEINIIPTGIEVPLPKINKLKKYDLSAQKYPTAIANGNRDPITFSIDLEMQYPVFLAYAIGLATTSGSDPYTHDLEEDVGIDIQSFTMHCEQDNDTDDNDIAYDLFGCVIDDYTLSINKADETVRETVTISCPACDLDGNINTGGINSMSDDIYTWNELLGDVSDSDSDALAEDNTWSDVTEYLLEQNDTDLTLDAVESITLNISNNVNYLPSLEYRHMVYCVATRRDVSLNMNGYISDKTLLEYWEDTWDNTNNRPNDAGDGGEIKAHIYLEKDSNTYIYIPICSLIPEEHSVEFASIDEGIKGADITLTAGVPDTTNNSAKRLFYDCDNQLNVQIKDSNDNTWYHNTT